jgi:hypothetical protein
MKAGIIALNLIYFLIWTILNGDFSYFFEGRSLKGNVLTFIATAAFPFFSVVFTLFPETFGFFKDVFIESDLSNETLKYEAYKTALLLISISCVYILTVVI